MIKSMDFCADTAVNTMRYSVRKLVEGPKAPSLHKACLMSKGLTEFEAIQLLNNPPRKILDLYVVIEKMEERIAEKDITEILHLLSPYSRNISSNG